MNTSRLFSLLFQGSLVKRIAAGLVLGIVVALISAPLQETIGFNLAEKVGVLGTIFCKSSACRCTNFNFLSCYGCPCKP